MTPTLALKLIVPTAFFGYAAIANLALVLTPDVRMPEAQGVLTGEITQVIDTLYRDTLPHKTPAIGLIGAARYVLLDEGRKGVVVGADGHLFTAEEFRPVDDTLYQAATAQITAAADRLTDAGIRLVIAPLPAKVDVMRDHAPDATATEAAEALYHRLLGDLRDLGIPAVDTRPALIAQRAPFLATDTHWTPAGARAVAAMIADSGMIDPGTEAFAVERDAPRPMTGDLVSYVTSDTLAPRVGLRPETVTSWRAVAHADDSDLGLLDLFGDDGAGTDLVGTSYSANPSWSFAEALKLELGRDVVNHAEEGRGPFAPMTAYLDRLDPMSPPQVVIWEIPVRYLTDPGLTATGAR
ncbi:hypothetical protein [Jannaschia sp. 2305UL9-9]|uniref:alginate O-acetyltransferase AlgX-related protein n=1 Tax=Jannaschia sp. 2305UL9-9 TaxID=3121638 RepID=UPI003529657C